ncbi:hypothetical protein DL96DRAFT_557814 [Flagelloscypha sp. PMI_526]|nr:hypothetical protein DL96DRAFT_557814 [Flagelloscypha sp. PMI_526]
MLIILQTTSPTLANVILQPRQRLTLFHATSHVVPDRYAHAAAAVWPLRRRECPVVSLGTYGTLASLACRTVPPSRVLRCLTTSKSIFCQGRSSCSSYTAGQHGANSSESSQSSFSAQSGISSLLGPSRAIFLSPGSDIGQPITRSQNKVSRQPSSRQRTYLVLP